MFRRAFRFALIGGCAAMLAACSGEANSMAHLVPSAREAAGAHSTSASLWRGSAGARADAIALLPARPNLLGIGALGATRLQVSEAGYSGGFRFTNGCREVASISPARLAAAGAVTLIGKRAGTCRLVVRDDRDRRLATTLTVTSAAFALSADSISPGSRSARVTLLKVNGKKPARSLKSVLVVALAHCSSGCTIAAPQAPPGLDTFAVAITDGAKGRGHTLAYATFVARVVHAQATTIPAALPKYIDSVAISGVPSATAGTPFVAAQPLTLDIRDVDGNPIVGTYVSAVTVSDSDTTGASALTLDGGTAGGAVSVANSSQRVALSYSGLAIAPATLGIGAGGYVAASTTFAPTLAPIAVTNAPTSAGGAGQAAAGSYEFDFNTDTSGPNSGNFALTQTGWTGAFAQNFTYALANANIKGDTNACELFTVTPASGTATAYTVAQNAKPPMGAPSAGACAIVLSGGGGKTATVYVTLGTVSVVIGLRHRS